MSVLYLGQGHCSTTAGTESLILIFPVENIKKGVFWVYLQELICLILCTVVVCSPAGGQRHSLQLGTVKIVHRTLCPDYAP